MPLLDIAPGLACQETPVLKAPVPLTVPEQVVEPPAERVVAPHDAVILVTAVEVFAP